MLNLNLLNKDLFNSHNKPHFWIQVGNVSTFSNACQNYCLTNFIIRTIVSICLALELASSNNLRWTLIKIHIKDGLSHYLRIRGPFSRQKFKTFARIIKISIASNFNILYTFSGGFRMHAPNLDLSCYTKNVR